MPLPLIPIATALLAGGTLVPHAAGGMIVTSAAGYVAGTYLSTSAIAGILFTATAGVGTGLTLAGSALKGIVGGTLARAAAAPVITGTIATSVTAVPVITETIATTGTVATGAVGALTTPVWVSATAGVAILGLGYSAYRLYKLKRKAAETPEGEEAQFTETEAKIVEKIIKRLAEKAKQTD